MVAKAQAVLSKSELLCAMFDVGYFPPNTPPDEWRSLCPKADIRLRCNIGRDGPIATDAPQKKRPPTAAVSPKSGQVFDQAASAAAFFFFPR